MRLEELYVNPHVRPYNRAYSSRNRRIHDARISKHDNRQTTVDETTICDYNTPSIIQRCIQALSGKPEGHWRTS
jgi:hypothetical protein